MPLVPKAELQLGGLLGLGDQLGSQLVNAGVLLHAPTWCPPFHTQLSHQNPVSVYAAAFSPTGLTIWHQGLVTHSQPNCL